MKATTTVGAEETTMCEDEATMKPRAARRATGEKGVTVQYYYHGRHRGLASDHLSRRHARERQRERQRARYGWRVAGEWLWPQPAPADSQRETLARLESMGTSNSAHRNTMICNHTSILSLSLSPLSPRRHHPISASYPPNLSSREFRQDSAGFSHENTGRQGAISPSHRARH